MDLVNESGLEVGWIVSQIDPPNHALTVVVKGTFQLQPDDVAIVADEQLPPTGDEFDGDELTGSLRYPFDFAAFKPRADVLLVGTCHAPGGTPAERVRVGLRFGTVSKLLDVYGDRIWIDDHRATAPVPFVSMPLNWNRAFGGPGFERNPVGTGVGPRLLPDGTVVDLLPNIERPDRPVRDRADAVEPAGFGPIPGIWPQRVQKVGKCDDRYLKERWPAYPADFDWSFFNTASDDQQLEEPLTGDEEFVVANLHPTIPVYQGQLPGLRVRALLNERKRGVDRLRDIQMRLDTVWIDMDAQRLVLVWRGHLAVRTETLQEAMHLLVATEPLSQAPSDEDAYEALLLDALERRAEEEDELDEEDPDEDEDQEADEAVEEHATVAVVGLSIMPAHGHPPVEQETGDVSVDAEDEPADDEITLSEAQVRERIARGASFRGCDLSGRVLDGLDFEGLDLRECVLEGASLLHANLSNADLTGAVLTRADLRESRCLGTNFTEADLTETTLQGADLSGADLTGVDLTKARLRSTGMRRVKAAEAIFSEADLSDADFEEANLNSADLCGALLHRTNFNHADLTDAALERSWGHQVTARGAVLRKVRGADASLGQADFRESIADESVWESADLFAADFTGASLRGAEFSHAFLHEAVFDNATLNHARFEEANLRRATLVRSNLYEASLGKADLTRATLTEANLFGATLMDSVITNTDFRGANLRRVKNRPDIT